MMNLSPIVRLIFVGVCISFANNVSARPIEMLEPIWCLNELQKNSLMEKLKPIMKQAETVELSLLAMRKTLYLTSERELKIAQDRLEACLKKTQPSCDQVGVKRLEKDIQGLDELEAKPLSDANKAKISIMVEKMRAARSEYPQCK